MGFSFPRELIKGDGYPAGFDRNMELSPQDNKEHVRRLYGPPRISPGEKSVPPPIPQISERTLKYGVCAPMSTSVHFEATELVCISLIVCTWF